LDKEIGTSLEKEQLEDARVGRTRSPAKENIGDWQSDM